MISNKIYGEEIATILTDVEKLLWLKSDENISYGKDAFRAAIKIFMTTLMDNMWELQELENLSKEDRINMAQKAGEDIKKLVKTYTNIDTIKLYE